MTRSRSSPETKPIKHLVIWLTLYHQSFDKLLCGHFIRVRNLRITSHQSKGPLACGPELSLCKSEGPLGGRAARSAASRVHISALAPEVTQICEELLNRNKYLNNVDFICFTHTHTRPLGSFWQRVTDSRELSMYCRTPQSCVSYVFQQL